MITKHWNIWCIARGEWVGCYCFLTNIFLITFKYLQNIAILCFQCVKFPWQKYNMLEADENGRMLFLHNEFLLYIFKCKWNRETRHLLKVLMDCSNQQNLKKLKKAISLSVHKRNILVITNKIVSLTRNFSKALVILAWFLLLFCYYFY